MKREHVPHVYCNIYKSHDLKSASVSTSGSMDKENVVYIQKRILFSHKIERNLAVDDNMDGPCGHYAK